jgi:hypothetical protein
MSRQEQHSRRPRGTRTVNSVAFSCDSKVGPALFVAEDWVVEGRQGFSGFLLIIERLVRLSRTKSLY